MAVLTLLRRAAARTALYLAQRVLAERLAKASLVLAIRRIGTAPDPLVSAPKTQDGDSVRPVALGRLLEGLDLGAWALGRRSIEEVTRQVLTSRPDAIIEFGSGASTIALAWAMRTCHGPSAAPRVFALEQDRDFAGQTRSHLERAGLADEARVLDAPLAHQQIEGVTTTCYLLPADLGTLLGGRSPQLLLIDGPAGPAAARFGTLPLVVPFLQDEAAFILDDALRDGELAILRRWRTLPYIRIHGIRLIEKGLLMGVVAPR